MVPWFIIFRCEKSKIDIRLLLLFVGEVCTGICFALGGEGSFLKMDILVFEDIRKIEAALLEPLCFRGSSLIIFRMRSASLPLVFPTTAEE